MNTRELQLGDWVNYIGAYHDEDSGELIPLWKTPIPIKVTFITPDAVQYEDEEGCYECSDYELHPIPLTPEILEKNGFEIQEQGGGRIDVWTGCGSDAEGDIEIEFDNGVPIHLKIDAAYKGEYYTSNNIHFLHDLQHALRLCGIEKEIEL